MTDHEKFLRSFPDSAPELVRPDNWTVADAGMEYAEMMDYHNQPYIGLKRMVKRKTIKQLWESIRAMWAENEKWKTEHGAYKVRRMAASSWLAREELRVEIEEGRV